MRFQCAADVAFSVSEGKDTDRLATMLCNGILERALPSFRAGLGVRMLLKKKIKKN